MESDIAGMKPKVKRLILSHIASESIVERKAKPLARRLFLKEISGARIFELPSSSASAGSKTPTVQDNQQLPADQPVDIEQDKIIANREMPPEPRETTVKEEELPLAPPQLATEPEHQAPETANNEQTEEPAAAPVRARPVRELIWKKLYRLSILHWKVDAETGELKEREVYLYFKSRRNAINFMAYEAGYDMDGIKRYVREGIMTYERKQEGVEHMKCEVIARDYDIVKGSGRPTNTVFGPGVAIFISDRVRMVVMDADVSLAE